MGILWLAAVALVLAGFVLCLRGQVLLGVALIVLGLLIGPGGVTIVNRR